MLTMTHHHNDDDDGVCAKQTYTVFSTTVSAIIEGAPQLKSVTKKPSKTLFKFQTHFEKVSSLTFRTETGTQQYQSYPGE